MTPSPLVSVIVPVLMEGDRINALIDHLRMVGYGAPIEIVVVDGDPAGATLAALDRPGVVALTAPRGRARQQNAGAAVASGDILLFLHADTRLPAGAFEAVTAALGGSARAGAFSLAIRSRHPWLRLVAAGANLRSRLCGLPYGDQALFFRRDAFFDLGGFPDIPVMEDVALLRALARAGGRPVIVPRKVTTSARRWQAEGPYRATWRNLGLLALYLCGVSPGRLAGRYPSMPELTGGQGEGGKEASSPLSSPPPIALMLKAPILGLVKTRLAAGIGPELALAAHRAMVADVLAAVDASGLPLTVHFTPADREREVRELCGPGRRYRPQVAGDLGARLEAALEAAFAAGAGAALVIGCDLPLLTAAVLRQAARELARHPAVLGPATDGGYYLLGLTRPAFGPHPFRNMPWSTDTVARRTLDVLEAAGTPAVLLPALSDCDSADDLRRLARPPLRERLAGPAMARFLAGLPADVFDQTPPDR